MSRRFRHIAVDEASAIKTVSPDYDSPDMEDLKRGDTHGRYPVIWHPESRTAYLGGEGWHHAGTYEHHGLMWSPEYKEGYFGGDPLWRTNGQIRWRDAVSGPDHAAVFNALQQMYPHHVRDPEYDAPEPPKEMNLDDLWDL